MKNTSNALRRVMSVVLVFAMMFTSMPTGALAEDVAGMGPSRTVNEPAAPKETEPTTPELTGSDPAPVTFTVTFVANGETLVTQTIQQGGSAVAPDAPLVSGQRFVRWDTDFTNVQSDLTVTAVYEAITAKNMTVEYRYSDGTQAAPSHVEQAVVGEPFHKTIPSPALDGFTPDKAEAVFAVESVTEDVTVVVTYSGAARNYTVKHLFQNVEGTAYAEDEALRETLEGTTGLDTAAQAKTVEGFTALPITQVKVASSGETVVEVKYDRNSYLLTWNTDGGSYIEPQMLKYGAAVSAPADPTKVGYTFAGWDSVPETMPAAATTVTAQWANATQASYQVVYWGENLTGGYDYLYADKATGAVGGNIPYSTSLTGSRMPQGLEAAGFELDSAKSAGNVEITADGSAVKNVYFSRRTFTVTFYLKSGFRWSVQDDLTISAKYGEDVSAQWNDSAHSRYMWYETSSLKTSIGGMKAMPAENLKRYGDTTRTVKIYYKTQTISGYGYDTYMEGVLPSGWTINEGDIIEIEGFTYERMNKNEKTLYYTRNSYNVVFQNCTGVSQKSLKFGASLSSAKPADSSVGRPAGMDSDYVFMGWYFDPAFQTPVDWSSTMPARNLQVYAKWAKPDYTVSFNTHGADTETPAPIGVAKYDTIEDQMPADPTREGYVFAGWYTDEAYTVPFVATQQIVRNLTLHAKWTRTDSCTYVIVAKDTEGNELKRVDGSEVEVGASVTVNAPVIDGYQAQQSSQNVKILDDGQEVVFVYDKLQNWTATVHHYIEGTTEKVAEDVIRSDLTVNSLLVYSATVSGYELAEGTSYVQTATRENSEITFYYKKIADSAYTVNHYYGSNASLTETVTGTAKAGSLVTADVINKAGYTCVTSGAALSAYVAKDGSTVINVYYAANDQTYSVYYYLEGTETPVPGTTAKENVSAKFDETVTETAPAVTGYTVAGDSTRSITVGADNAANKIVFYYTVNSYPLNITYKYADDVPDAALRGQKAAEPVSRDIAFGAPYSVASPLIPGYTASVAAVAGTMAENGVTVEVVYRAATDTAYTVKHMLQDVTGDGYTEDAAARQTLHGTTGADTNAAAKSYEGFTAQAVVQQAIAADGSTVVEIKYDRNSYEVTYAYVGTAPAGASALPEKATVKYGAPVAVAAAATAPGYTFSGWSQKEDFTMPAENVTITGSFTANGDTAYTVEHYQQNLAGDGYDLVEADTEHLTGETDTTATANPKTYTGFTFDGTVEGTVASGNIAGDGSLVLKLYYTRNSYDVTYAYTGTVPADASALAEKAAVKYGASVTVAEAATAKGHTFSGWSTGDFTMPAQDVEITGSFTANPYNVTVEYYFDKAQDTDMTRVQSVTYGETFTTAAAAETDRNGVHYTLDWVENNGLTVSDIEADNVVRVYYAKDEEGGPDDIPDYAQIVFTYQSADVRKGTVDKSVEIHTFERLNGELLEEKKASPAGANAAGREGYAFDYWTDGTKRDVTSGMETLKSEVYTDNAEFTAYFDVDTKGTDPENPDKPDNVPDKYQAKVTYQAVNGAVTLGGSTGTELVTYVTLFDADGKWAENGTGKLAEAQVPTAAAAADYDPATERWTPAVPAEGAEITADGAVFTVTWELAISGYQVHYYYDGVEDTASAVNATGKIGDAIPYDTGKTTFDGANYVLENVDGAGKLISKDAATNIVNVNFTKDEKSDPTKDPDPEVPGDNIPDKYQATVTFEAINGVLQPKGGTDAQNTKQMTTVVTLLNENGEPAENGTGYLTEAQIPTALANLGYIANTLFWGPATPTTSYAITGDITFVADFNAEGVIPEEPPVPPVTPVGPTAPEEGSEETIDEPETPLAPAEPEAPAEEPAEEEIEEADTPLASGAAWALLNLILMLCTALVSILLLIGFLGKKKKEDENENVEYTVKRKGVTRVLSLIPAIGSIIAFLLTENMRNPMVFVDRWTWLMVLIALVQVIVCIFARKEKEEPDDNAQTPAQA